MEWIGTLKLFVSAVRSGSLSAAGRNLGYSPAAVSRHITALEIQLGTRLLSRSSRKLALTEAGEIYLNQVEKILHQLREANESVTQLQGIPRGILRIHSRMLVGQQIVVPALPDFLRRYPDIKIDLSLSNNVVSLIEQNFDVDIRIGKLDDSALVARRLTPSERIVCVAPSYLIDQKPILTPHDLTTHNCLTYNARIGPAIWKFKAAGDQILEVPVGGSFRTDNGQSILQMLKAGMGIGLMPDWSIREELASGELIRLFTDYQAGYIEFENGVYAVYQKSRQPSPKLKVFVDYLITVFRQRLS